MSTFSCADILPAGCDRVTYLVLGEQDETMTEITVLAGGTTEHKLDPRRGPWHVAAYAHGADPYGDTVPLLAQSRIPIPAVFNVGFALTVTAQHQLRNQATPASPHLVMQKADKGWTIALHAKEASAAMSASNAARTSSITLENLIPSELGITSVTIIDAFQKTEVLSIPSGAEVMHPVAEKDGPWTVSAALQSPQSGAAEASAHAITINTAPATLTVCVAIQQSEH